MHDPIRKVGVIGAGVMGSGIAAHMANASIAVELLDIVPPGSTSKEPSERNAIAQRGLDAAVKAKPAAFFHKSRASLVRTGNLEDHLDRLSSCDLVIEAVIERLDIKQKLFERLEKVIPKTTVVASNTSGLRIADMLKGRGEAFKKNFLVMHFFNPVRYMKLLELVVGPETSDGTRARIEAFGRDTLGKGIVYGKDTPNFVGNRIGVHAMMTTIHGMLEHDLTPEDVDAITGPPMAHPKSASFRTGDLVGLDTFAHVAQNCFDALENDEDRNVFELPEYIRVMVDKKLLGNKTKAGFYRKNKDRSIDTFDPKTLDYRPKGGDQAIRGLCKEIGKIEDPRERVRKLVQDDGKAGKFAWHVVSRSLAYAARRIPEIADDVASVDHAMRWGYSWDLGPFETWDALGFKETAERMKSDGIALPKTIETMLQKGATSFYKDGKVFDLKKGDYVAQKCDPREIELPALRKGTAPVLKNDGAEAWDLGDDILGITFKTKANSIDPDVIQMLGDAVERAERDFRGVLIANQGEHFCVGANLFLVVMAAGNKQWDQITAMVKGYQDATQRMKYARVPVVSVPYGMTLGGGLELCLASDGVQAAAETYSGLVEVGVGLIPGGAGTLNLLSRAFEAIPDGTTVPTYDLVTNVFKSIALAKIATSADEGKAFGYFRPTDGVSFDRARQLFEAKARLIGMANAGYHPPAPRTFSLPGESGIATLRMMVGTLVDGGHASEHDALIANKLARVLSGGAAGATRPISEQDILDLEREAFVSLCGEAKTQERMQYMLMNNKPLRN